MLIKQNRGGKMPAGRALAGVVFMMILGAGVLLFLPFDEFGNKTYHLKSVGDPLANPLMGWAPWANLSHIEQPHTLVYADLSWREFEPREGEFDFEKFEAQQQFDRWRREGKRVVFRFVVDYPGAEAHMDIPEWLFEMTGQSGSFYDTEYGRGFSPDYSNPVFISRHELAIKALADRYSADGFFAFVELGSLGHWGEWHLHPEAGQMPPQNIRDIYVHHYKAAFTGTHLLMRRPFTVARDLNLGLYNDMSGNPDATAEWLEWIVQGGDVYPETNAMAPMPDGWKVAPIGGEQSPALRDDDVYGADLAITLDLLKRSHTTFIGPEGAYDVPLGAYLQPGLDQTMALIGYRFRLGRVEMPVKIWFGDRVSGKLTLLNDGIAPFYYDWRSRVYVYDPDDQIVASSDINLDLRKILPGGQHQVEFSISIEGLKDGRYTIGFAIIDPLTGLPGVRLANESLRQDLVQEMGAFEIRRIFND